MLQRTVNGIGGFFEAVRKINEKYRHPRIRMTPMVSFWLLMLRLYLIGMLLLLLYTFVTSVIH